MNAEIAHRSSSAANSLESPPAGYIANIDLAFAYKPAGGKDFLRKFEFFESDTHFHIVGRDPRRTHVQYLTINRRYDEILIDQSVTLMNLTHDLSHYNNCIGLVVGGKNAQREWQVEFLPHHSNTRLTLWFKDANLSVRMFESIPINFDNVDKFIASKQHQNSHWKKHDGFSGLLGFAEFTDGKYLVGVTKKEVVARICGSDVFSVSNTIFLPFKHGSEPSATEQRYRTLFKMIDLTRGFYFSYDYDLSRSLQSNMGGRPQPLHARTTTNDRGISRTFDEKFVWNFHLLRLIPHEYHCWAVYLMHGYVEQHRLSIGFNRVVSLALLARRSRHFAGTRYRKRGQSMQGHCANEVETEQIIIDESHGSSSGGHCFTSFVQLRASIPLFWSQPTELNFKPDVYLHNFDPLYHVTAIHMSHLLRRYGSPIHVLNLIKGSEESKKRESLLNDEFKNAIDTLNAGISEPQHSIGYTHFDFHYKHKRDHVGVFDELRRETEAVVNRVGIFHSGTNRWASSNPQDAPVAMCMQQQGVLRSNCIDCLDRTNVAQFYAGVKAMSLQLQALGISNTPVPMESDLPRMLMEIYCRMGNELALQYVGSVAHDKMGGTGKTTNLGLKTFSKLVVSAQRYISNTFTDIEKQQAIDVFLGTFVPRAEPMWVPIWNADDLSFCWGDKLNPQYTPLRRNRPLDDWWRVPLAQFHSGYQMGSGGAEARLIELQPASILSCGSSGQYELLKVASGGSASSSYWNAHVNVCASECRCESINLHKNTQTFHMMLAGIDVNFDRTHAKGKYVTFEPLLDPKDPAQEKRTSTVDDGDKDSTVIFADDFSMLDRECNKPQRLQAYPTTDSHHSVLSLMANLFTQRSLDRNNLSKSSLELFSHNTSRDWRLETTISSTAEHGLIKTPIDFDFHAGSDHVNASLLKHVMTPLKPAHHHAFQGIDPGILNPTPRRHFSDAMDELFAYDHAIQLEAIESSAFLGCNAAAASQLKPPFANSLNAAFACFVDEDESSSEASAMKPFLNCSQDWEQLRSLSGAPVGITIELRDDGFGARRAVIIAYPAEAAESSQDIRVGDEIISIMVMGKNCEYDGLDLIELLSEEFEPAYDRIMQTLHGCSGTQVVLSIVRAGQPVGHVCLVRDGLIDGIAATPLPLSGAGRVRRVSF